MGIWQARSAGWLLAGLLYGASPCVPAETSEAGTETGRLNAFLERVFERDLAQSPQSQSGLGMKANQDRWDDIGEAHRIEQAALDRQDLERLRQFDYQALSPDARLSYELFEFNTLADLKRFEWRRNRYEISHRSGLHNVVPHTLVNNHPIETPEDARDYVARLRGVKPLFEQLVRELERDEAAGTLTPRFDVLKVRSTAADVIAGAPLDDSDTVNSIWADYTEKLEAADLTAGVKRTLREQGRIALDQGFRAGYEHLIDWLDGAAQRATDEAGVWKLADGEAFYAAQLELRTTVPISADEVHRVGLAEVARIHEAMRALRDEVGFDGSLAQFFEFVKNDERFYFAASDAGRAAYLTEMRRVAAAIRPRLPELFRRLPRMELEIRRLEPWRERNAGTAGYFAGSPDGSRPGIVYVNLHDMRRMPRYEISSLLYHEGIPGHHLQSAISRELEGLPRFRRFGGYTAYSEGWALYAEKIPAELGLYEDPWQRFGQLSMELMRAGRLVVDSGLHAKRWTRDEALAWLDENTPVSHAGNVVAVDRYITLPAQATAYAIGSLKIRALRREAEDALGARFDVAAFHDELLNAGPLPLPILEKKIRTWIASFDAG